MSIDEYPIFIREMSNGVIDVTSFSALPFVLQVNFVYLNCLCTFDLSNDQCCTSVNSGGIVTSGSGPGEETTTTDAEALYLNVVCSDTQAGVDYAIEEGVPTKRPTTTLAPVSVPPSDSPTIKPTTMEPTDSPSKKPTLAPSPSPTNQPTAFPSNSPVVIPSPTTNSPVSIAPVTNAPVLNPTSSPSVLIPLTKAPSITIQTPTTKAPIETGMPSSVPSLLFVIVPTTIRPDSEAPTTRKPSSVPSLFVSVPTTLGPVSEVPTTRRPTDVQQPDTLTPTLQYFLPSAQPSIATRPTTLGVAPDNRDTTTVESIAPGALAGIVLAFVGVAFVGVLVTRKRKRDDGEEEISLGALSDKDRDLEAGEGKGSDDSPGNKPVGSDSSNMSSLTPPEDKADAEIGNYVPQAVEPQTPPPLDPALLPIVAGLPPSPRYNDDSSSAGASGWSSSAGISSINTGSLHDASLASESFDTTNDGMSLGSPKKTLATIAAASAVVEGTKLLAQHDSDHDVFLPMEDSESAGEEISVNNSSVGIHSTPQGEVSRADLNMAIEAGDWAAVGATAALLAGNTQSKSDSRGDDASKSTRDSSLMDASGSTDELDALMTTEGWEGVVLASSNVVKSVGSGSLEEDDSVSFNSKGDRDISDIRSEVDLLVRRVVPDEVENVDEMMHQFKGREEELIETLRTMYERTVAQRARQAVRKSARLEAKSRAAENLEEQLSRASSFSSEEDPSFFGDSEDDSFISDLDSRGVSRIDDSPSSKQTNISSLERAVQQGDWLAVGEAAAMMGGIGITPADVGSGETSSYVESDSMQDSSYATSTITSTLSSNENRESRISHLDDLISKGDWSGIVAAAGKYQAIDEQLGQASEEELDALAEANMWKKIASGSKENTMETDESAVAATDWAISRSLGSHLQNSSGAGESEESI